MEQVESQFAIKLRSDEFYSNLDKLILTIPDKKTTTSNIFVRDIHYKNFHLSDHIIISNTDILKHAFKNLMGYIINSKINKTDKLDILSDRIPAEVKVTLFILFEYKRSRLYNWNTLRSLEVYNLLKDYFNIVDINKLNPYIVNSSFAGKIFDYSHFVEYDTKLGLREIKCIKDIYPRNFLQKFLDKRKIKLRKFKKYFIGNQVTSKYNLNK